MKQTAVQLSHDDRSRQPLRPGELGVVVDEMGVAGDAVMADNRIEVVDLILGCAWLGAVLIPLNTGLRGGGLRQVLRAAEPQFLLAEQELAERVVAAGFQGELWVVGGDGVPAPGMSPAVPSAQVRPDDTAFVLFTSGTTGAGRGVRCPHAQTVWWGRNVSGSLRLTADDVLYTCLPLFHTNALNTLAHAMAVGASCVIGERFSATRYWERVAEAGATVVYLLGAMVPMLLLQPPSTADRAHRAWRGLSPPPPARRGSRFGSGSGSRRSTGSGRRRRTSSSGPGPRTSGPVISVPCATGSPRALSTTSSNPWRMVSSVSWWFVAHMNSPSAPATWGSRYPVPPLGGAPGTGCP